MEALKIGTRGSALALAQTKLVAELIKSRYGQVKIETVVMQTKGDKNLDQPFAQIGDKGLFVSELEQALLDERIDLAVHSAKDLPIRLAKELEILAVPKRGDARDVLVTRKAAGLQETSFQALGEGAVIGTGSQRRSLYMKKIYPHAKIKLIRGNVKTRLNKLKDGLYDGIILAKAGLDRLGLMGECEDHFWFRTLSIEECMPAACQGILAVEGRRDLSCMEKLKTVSHQASLCCFETERRVLECLQADCSEPAAAYCQMKGSEISLRVMYGGKEAVGNAVARDRLLLAEQLSKEVRTR